LRNVRFEAARHRDRDGLKVVGNVTAEGLVEVYGEVEGEIRCKSLLLSRKAKVTGGIIAERVVINGRVEGPIHAGQVVLKSRAHVIGDINHQTLSIKKGAYFEGRSVQPDLTKEVEAGKPKKQLRSVPNLGREAPAAAG
jgi:cytoskeletal protein CcmA (bactofilin family)